MNRFFYLLIMLTTVVATACTNTDDDADNNDSAEDRLISFSVEEDRAPITRSGFASDTKIAMRMKSKKNVANSKDSLFTFVTATAAAENGGYSNIKLADKRCWDDAFGREAKLSVYAIAVPGVNDNRTVLEDLLQKGTGMDVWFTETDENETISWTVAKNQTSDTIKDQDLTYSNNISENGKEGVYKYDFDNNKYPDYGTNPSDGCMEFRQKEGAVTDAPGKFDKGRLVFNHALSRVSLNLIKGAGFGDGENVFKFDGGTNVKILNVPTSGKLDLTTGKWTVTASEGISKMAEQTAATGVNYALMAQFLPGYVITDGSTTNMLEFSIDGNVYNVNQNMMFDALNNASQNKDKLTFEDGNKVIMAQGINYAFDITVNKTGVNVTATLVDFTTVPGTLEPSNAYVSLSFADGITGNNDTGFALYRTKDNSASTDTDKTGWKGDYEGPATLKDKGNGIFDSDWYFADNNTLYHFRTVKSGTKIVAKDENTDVDDYFKIESGKQDDAHDYHWGAPMKYTPTYSTTKGYTDCLYRAIGATSDKISMVDFHVMSKITINLTTTDGTDKVTLAGSKITISKFNANGKVLMGTGLVEVTGSSTGSLTLDGNTEGTVFTCSVVPQELVRGSGDDDYVCITIETGDHNKYNMIKQLSTIKDDKNAPIERWLPGHFYTYTFSLKKTGIDKVSATITGWENVSASDDVWF